jgi:hypothetical protein
VRWLVDRWCGKAQSGGAALYWSAPAGAGTGRGHTSCADAQGTVSGGREGSDRSATASSTRTKVSR